ncbi:MAG: acyl transferase [Flavobacterium sp.]|nr:MAG: acyl transferase [Flavobacterium sp.]
MINKDDIFSIAGKKQLDKIALKVFRHQYQTNSDYREFCDYLQVIPEQVKTIAEIPFLPIEFFKSREILSSTENAEITFTSSGTTGMSTSRHLVTDLSVYEESFRRGFSHFYGDIENYVVLALLPSYLEREGSSLVYMVEDMIRQSKKSESGFYLHDLDKLAVQLAELDERGENVLLIGVTYGLLDLIEKRKFNLRNTIVMETGGMKGKRREMIREELHKVLCDGFGVTAIHSEYGMTELLSQAYSLGYGRFGCPNWMQILIRDTEDAREFITCGKTGGINVIDLANYNSCSFIATQDLGKAYADNTFEVLGRFDNSDIRGCNLMVI